MGIKIVIYTHTDYNHVWPLWFGQTKKYLNDFEKIIFVNKNSDLIPNDYKIITYDEKLNYNDRVFSCLEKLDEDDIIIFHHEDMFLYDEPNMSLIYDLTKIIEKNESLIKLIRAGNGEKAEEFNDNLYFNPKDLNYSIQPTLVKVRLLKKIYGTNKGNTIWEFEKNAGNNMNTKNSFYFYDGEPLRGLSHYDSKIYPYIATAIVKGSWNFQEYNEELTKLFNEYEINNI